MKHHARTHAPTRAAGTGDGTTAFGGAALAMAARALATVATAAGVLLTAGSLSGADFGAYALATGIVGVIVVASDLGMTQSLMRAHADGRSTRGLVIRAAAVRVGVTGGAGAAAAAVVGAGGSDAALLVLAATMLGVTQSASGMAVGLLGAQRRARLLAITTIARPSIELVGFLAVALVAPSPIGFIAVSMLAAGTAALVAGSAIVRGTPRRSDHPTTLRAIARYGSYLALVTLLWSASLQVDQVVIAAVHGAAAVATYAFVWKVLMVLAIGAISAAAIVAPWATDRTVSPRERAETFRSWHTGLVVAAGALAGCMAAVGPLAVALVNPDFAGDALLAAGLAPALPLLASASFTSACLGYLGARGRLRPAVELLVGNLALDALLVPWLGAWGAVIASNIVLTRWAIAHHRLAVRALEAIEPRVEVPRLGAALIAATTLSAAVVAAPAVAAAAVAHRLGAPEFVVAIAAAAVATLLAAMRVAPTVRRLRASRPSSVFTVLHLADFRAPYPGTFIRQFEVLAEAIAEHGGRVSLAIPHDAAGHDWARALAGGDLIDLHVLPEQADRSRRARAAAVLELMREVRPAVVHTHFSTFDLPASVAVVRLTLREGWRPRLAWYYRTTIEGDGVGLPLRRRLREAVRWRGFGAPVDVVTTISDGMAEQVARLGGRRTVVVRGGCDTQRFTPRARDAASEAARSATRARLGAADDDVLLLHMGWHWVLKGGDVVDAAVGQLRTDADRTESRRLVVRSIGMAPDASAEHVEPLEQVSDMRELLHAADIFLATSRWEAFGNALVEAMSCGLVAVASDAPGHQLTATGAPGVWMAKAGDVETTVAALEEALAAHESWHTLGLQNRSHVVDRFDVHRWATQLAGLHARLAGQWPRMDVKPDDGSSADDDGSAGDDRGPAGPVSNLDVHREAAG